MRALVKADNRAIDRKERFHQIQNPATKQIDKQAKNADLSIGKLKRGGSHPTVPFHLRSRKNSNDLVPKLLS